MKFNLNNRFFNNCFEIIVFLILKPRLQNNATTIQTTLWYLLMFTIITPNPAFSAVRPDVNIHTLHRSILIAKKLKEAPFLTNIQCDNLIKKTFHLSFLFINLTKNQ